MLVAVGTFMAAGSSKYIYIASFFMGAAGASKAEHISLDIANTGVAVQIFSAWALLTIVLSRIECLNVACSSTAVAAKRGVIVWNTVTPQLWKILVVICTHYVFAWSNVKANADKERTNVEVQMTTAVENEAVANDSDDNEDDEDNDSGFVKGKLSWCSDDCGSLVLGVYVFGSGVQSVLRVLVGRVAELNGAEATLLNFCLSVPIVTVLAACFARVQLRV
jgi:hypothetical protein